MVEQIQIGLGIKVRFLGNGKVELEIPPEWNTIRNVELSKDKHKMTINVEMNKK